MTHVQTAATLCEIAFESGTEANFDAIYSLRMKPVKPQKPILTILELEVLVVKRLHFSKTMSAEIRAEWIKKVFFGVYRQAAFR